MNSTEKTILTLAAGIAIGAGLGLLFAPAKGKETRTKIKREFDQCCDKFDEMMEDFSEKIAEGTEKIAQIVSKDGAEQSEV